MLDQATLKTECPLDEIERNVSLEQQESCAVDSLIQLFNKTFNEFNTLLVRGTDEPIYLPASNQHPVNQIVFAHGFFNSALHEVAHWCIAGTQRRTQLDYGYWYCPDGRDEQQQTAFEKVEVKPQALEWAFSTACGRLFAVSTDNLNGAEPNRQDFALAVQSQLCEYINLGFPQRAQRFIDACHIEFNTPELTISACLSASKDLT